MPEQRLLFLASGSSRAMFWHPAIVLKCCARCSSIRKTHGGGGRESSRTRIIRCCTKGAAQTRQVERLSEPLICDRCLSSGSKTALPQMHLLGVARSSARIIRCCANRVVERFFEPLMFDRAYRAGRRHALPQTYQLSAARKLSGRAFSYRLLAGSGRTDDASYSLIRRPVRRNIRLPTSSPRCCRTTR
jgi:hypothetical protein